MHDLSTRYLIGVFGAALVVGLFLMLLPHRLTETTDVPTAIEHYGERRLGELAEETARGALGVVVLGDSRLLYGIHRDARLSSELSGPEQDVSVLKLAVGAATIRDYVSLTPEILKARPALVIVQEDLFERHESRPPREASSKEAVLWAYFGGDHWNPGEGLFALNEEWTTCPPNRLSNLSPDESIELILDAQQSTGMEYLVEGEHIELLDTFLGQLDDAGIETAVLKMPETQLAAERIERLHAQPPGATIGTTAQVDDLLYCDPAHLSPEGRETFMAQILPELKALLPSPQVASNQ